MSLIKKIKLFLPFNYWNHSWQTLKNIYWKVYKKNFKFQKVLSLGIDKNKIVFEKY